mmetsp:Transcript_18979/g.13776  ORF Transcript_18979/g.13776 Transcript_18979/m.13776 type:complete len:107 (-) Transcript_18979:793-1113(-)
MFNYKEQIKRYSGPEEIMEEFFGLRKQLYERRKEYQLARLRKECEVLANKVRFILGVISGEIRINNVKRQIIVETLVRMGFKTMSELNTILKEPKKEEHGEEADAS